MRHCAITALLLGGFLQGCSSDTLTLGPDCEPDSWPAQLQEKWLGTEYWKAQVKYLDQNADMAKRAYRVFLIEQQQDRANAAFESEKYQAYGIPQQTVPGLEEESAKLDRNLHEMERARAQRAVDLDAKCEPYAKARSTGFP